MTEREIRSDKERYGQAATLAGAFAHPLRVAILTRLLQAPCCVGDVVCNCGVAQPKVSQHLNVLLQAGLVTRTTQGRRREYALTHPERVRALFAALGLEGEEDPSVHAHRDGA